VARTRSSAGEALGFRHEALLYAGDADFVDATVPFVRGALQDEQPVLVAVLPHKIDLLRDELGDDADRVAFADMGGAFGRNPARLIPAWQKYLRGCPPGVRVRGVGEPIWAGRSPQEQVECQRHESLLNVAFAGSERLWFLCPYDVDALDDVIIDEVFRSHPFVRGDHHHPGDSRPGDAHAAAFLDTPLTPPPDTVEWRAFSAEVLGDIRRRVRAFAAEAALTADQVDDLELAVGEVMANSVVHGGGHGNVAWWSENGRVMCEVRDRGRITDPLAGRRDPAGSTTTGRGLWLVNQLCDLVQIRVFRAGTTLRLHLERTHSYPR
jgi:anti-sigma regulatory factor (Ser/Thr protein kinase)